MRTSTEERRTQKNYELRGTNERYSHGQVFFSLGVLQLNVPGTLLTVAGIASMLLHRSYRHCALGSLKQGRYRPTDTSFTRSPLLHTPLRDRVHASHADCKDELEEMCRSHPISSLSLVSVFSLGAFNKRTQSVSVAVAAAVVIPRYGCNCMHVFLAHYPKR